MLVAGAAGLEERGPVRWTHISELPDPTPWLEGGEVLLTTGLGVRDSEVLQRRLIAGLDRRGCAAVGFGVGVVCDEVPAAMVAEADRRALPLFTVPYEVPFIAVTKRVSHHIFAEHYATLRSAIDLHRSVLAVVLSDGGVAGVIDTVGRQLPGFGCVLFDYYGRVLAERAAAGRQLPQRSALWDRVGVARRARDRFEEQLGDAVVTASVIRLGDEREGVLAAVGDRPLDEDEALLWEQGVTGVSLELARGVSVREAHRARIDDLLGEVAENRIGHRSLTRQLARLGADPTARYRVLCLRGRQPGVSDRALCDLVEDVLAADGTPVVGRYEDAVFALAQPAAADQGARVAGALTARGWTAVSVGRSGVKTDVETLDTAMREAAAAAAARPRATSAGGVADVTSLGLTGVLAGIDGRLAADALVAPVLGPVLEHDAREGSQLVASLRAYLDHGCRPGPAAAALGVHRHTLAYRLDRVAALTGRDLRSGRDLLELGLALELHARVS